MSRPRRRNWPADQAQGDERREGPGMGVERAPHQRERGGEDDEGEDAEHRRGGRAGDQHLPSGLTQRQASGELLLEREEGAEAQDEGEGPERPEGRVLGGGQRPGDDGEVDVDEQAGDDDADARRAHESPRTGPAARTGFR